ncbi:MAG: lipoprotein [Succinivibrionaceae bacterium]
MCKIIIFSVVTVIFFTGCGLKGDLYIDREEQSTEKVFNEK